MDKIIDYFNKLINKQIDEFGIIIWYDPDHIYEEVLDRLRLNKVNVFKYRDSFIRLRYEIEPFMAQCERPKLLVYIPLDRAKTDDAMVEAEVAGCYLAPAHPEKVLNTKLEQVAYHILMPAYTDEIEAILEKIKSGAYTLVDVDRIAASGFEMTTGTLKLVYGKTEPLELAIHFLTSPEKDDVLQEKNAVPEVANLLNNLFGYDNSSEKPVTDLRDDAFLHLLISDFITTGQFRTVSEELSRINIPEDTLLRQNIVECVQSLRERSSLNETYNAQAKRVESLLGLADMSFNIANLLNAGTFPFQENDIYNAALQALQKNDLTALREIIEKRQDAYWTKTQPYNLGWEWLVDALEFLEMAESITQSLKSGVPDLDGFIAVYSDPENGWHNFDALFRTLETSYQNLESGLPETDDRHEQAKVITNRKYSDTLWAMNEAFQEAFVRAKCHSAGYLQQRNVFADMVQPHLDDQLKVAYLLIDAFRYEMLMSIRNALSSMASIVIEPALAQLPAITTIGMAALMPGAGNGISLVRKNKGIGLGIAGKDIVTREDRCNLLAEHFGERFTETRLDKIIRPSKAIREKIEKADLILVTSQEIDQLGEGFDAGFARNVMITMLTQIRRGITELLNLGVNKIVITADHGYLFGSDLTPGTKLDAPAGESAGLHRRAWIGSNANHHDAYIRLTEKEIGLNGDLELVFPKNISCFKVPGGNESYFHGGISLQEMIIPVVTITAKPAEKSAAKRANFKVTMDREHINNRFFSIKLAYTSSDLFADQEARIRVQVLSGKDEVGNIATAHYGLEDQSGDIIMQKDKLNTLTIVLNKESVTELDIIVTDPETRKQLDAIKKIPVSLMI